MTLQMALILIAIVVVAGVYFYSRRDGPRSGNMRFGGGKPGKRETSRATRRDRYTEPTLGAAGGLYPDPVPDDLAESDASTQSPPENGLRVDEEEDPGSIEFSIASEPGTDIALEDNVQKVSVTEEQVPGSDEPDIAVTGETRNNRTEDSDQDESVPPVLDLENDRVNQETGDPGESDIQGDIQDIPVLESRVDSSRQVEAAELSPQPDSEVTTDAPVLEEPEVGEHPIDESVTDVDELVMEEPVMIAEDPVESGQEADDTGSRETTSAPSPAYIVNDGELDNDLDGKRSIKELVGSMNPIQKLRGSIRHQLDIVKAEREGKEPPAGKDSGGNRKKSGVGLKWWKSDRKKDRGPAADMRARDRELTPHTEPEPEQWDDKETLAPLDRDAPVFGEDQVDPVVGADAPGPEPVATSAMDRDLAPADGFDKLSQIDYYVKLNGDRDVSRESVLAIYREGAAELSKKHSIYGLRMPDKVWSDLENEPEESRFGDLVITLQLVDQEGPVNENDMVRFSRLVEKLSESTGRGFAYMAPIESAHEQALAIDRFRKRFDAIFVVNIVPMEGEELFEGPVIDRCATQIGLTADDNGFYARYKPMGRQRVCLYSLANFSDTGEFDMENLRAVRTRGVTFFTRPTINRSPGAVFSEMVDAARAFASRIKGEVIAPGFDDLSNEDVEKIRQSIDTVAKDMERYGINPGSDEATRLF